MEFFPLPLAIVIATGLFVAYMTPTWLAVAARLPSSPVVGVVNMVTGWTILGFILCLAYVADEAFRHDVARDAAAAGGDDRDDAEPAYEPRSALAA